MSKFISQLFNFGEAVDAALTTAKNFDLAKQVASESIEFTSITRNADGVIVSGEVIWLDGTTGTFTTDTIDEAFSAIDAYTVTHPTSGQKVVQLSSDGVYTLTRDADGAITEKPPLTVQNI